MSDKLTAIREKLAARRKEKALQDEKEQIEKGDVGSLASNTAKGAASLPAKSTGSVNALQRAKNALTSAEEQFHKEKDSGLFQWDDLGKVPSEVDSTAFMDNLERLRLAQLSRTPELGSLCVEVIKNMRSHEELVHLLNDEQLAIVTGSALMKAKVEIKNSAKSKGLAEVKSAGDGVSADDFEL